MELQVPIIHSLRELPAVIGGAPAAE